MADWRNFAEVIEQARVACDSSGGQAGKHFVATTTMVDIGSGAKRERTDWYLKMPSGRIFHAPVVMVPSAS